MDFTAPSQRAHLLRILSAACGAMLTAGAWWALSAVPATSSAYVRVQSSSGVQVAMQPTRRVRHVQELVPVEPTAAPASSTALAAAPLFIMNALAAAAPWLSIVAILLQWKVLVRFVSNLFGFGRQAEDIPTLPVPAYNSAYNAYSAPPDFEEVRTRSNRMDEVAKAVSAEQASRKYLTPKQVVLELQRGNARFWSGTPERPELNAMERRALIVAQAPTVAILSCSDSRVPVEIVFDQGLGSIFVVRVAGNILDSSATGSLEFAVKYLGVKVLLVMGHEACGAVKGAINMSKEEVDQQPAYLQSVLRNIKSNLNVPQLQTIRDVRAQDREAIVVNATNQVKKLQKNRLIAERVADGNLLVCGAFYEITSGIVDFFSLDKNGLVVDL